MAPRPTLTERNQRVIRMKDELIKVLDLVTRCRESLEGEVSEGLAAKMKGVDLDFLRRLKELTVMFSNMTDARIRLDKAEKLLENDLTPLEERQAVIEYIHSMENQDRGEFLRTQAEYHLSRITSQNGKAKSGLIRILSEAETLQTTQTPPSSSSDSDE